MADLETEGGEDEFWLGLSGPIACCASSSFVLETDPTEYALYGGKFYSRIALCRRMCNKDFVQRVVVLDIPVLDPIGCQANLFFRSDLNQETLCLSVPSTLLTVHGEEVCVQNGTFPTKCS